MDENKILKMIENMQWDLKRMPLGKATEIADKLELIKDYINNTEE